MPLNTMRDLLINQLNELYGAEKHSAAVLPRLAKAASSSKLGAAFRAHADETREHLSRLESVFEELGASPRAGARAESKGMKGLCQDCLKLAEMPKVESHVRDAALIAVAQHVEHDEIAGYGCARTWAGLLGHEEAAEQLQKTLDEERKADAALTRLAENLNKQAVSATVAA
jgi:ferritin-like metal-binding protein YciE